MFYNRSKSSQKKLEQKLVTEVITPVAICKYNDVVNFCKYHIAFLS